MGSMDLISQDAAMREELKTRLKTSGADVMWPEGPVNFHPEATLDDLVKQGEQVGLKSYPGDTPDILSLKHTALFGIKGVCTYADHAQILGQEDDSIYAYVHEGLDTLVKNFDIRPIGTADKDLKAILG